MAHPQSTMDPELIHTVQTHDLHGLVPISFSSWTPGGAPQSNSSYSFEDGFPQYIVDQNVPLHTNFMVEARTNDAPEATSSASTNDCELQSYSPAGQFRNVLFPIVSPGLRNNGHAHTILPPVIRPNPEDPSMQFDSETRTFNQRVPPKNSSSADADPHAANFLRQQLGAEKWNTFSARLFERRLGTHKLKPRSSSKHHGSEDRSGASTIDFLVKVEIVKEILRTYVPHPYNPLKALSHPFLDSPNGQVTLTRSTVLALSGWSNTQFSYWARRVEGVSVLSEHDERLQTVVTALERRLRGEHSDEDCAIINTTGKGLDNIIDEVKRRTGKSQFLRGKHSSLDPFGSLHPFDPNSSTMPVSGLEKDRCEWEARGMAQHVYNTSFQALAYLHEVPRAVVRRMDGQAWQGERKQQDQKRRRGGDSGALEEELDLARRVEDVTTPASSEPQSVSSGKASVTESRRSPGASISTHSPHHIPSTISDSWARNNQSTRLGRETSMSTTSPPMSSHKHRYTAMTTDPVSLLQQQAMPDGSSPKRKRLIR